MIIFFRVSANFFNFFFARKREKKIKWVFFVLFFVLFGGCFCAFWGCFLISRISANFFLVFFSVLLELFFALSQAKPGILSLAGGYARGVLSGGCKGE